MKKSEIYYISMLAVAGSSDVSAYRKIEVIEQLMADKRVAEHCERQEDAKPWPYGNEVKE